MAVLPDDTAAGVVAVVVVVVVVVVVEALDVRLPQQPMPCVQDQMLMMGSAQGPAYPLKNSPHPQPQQCSPHSLWKWSEKAVVLRAAPVTQLIMHRWKWFSNIEFKFTY